MAFPLDPPQYNALRTAAEESRIDWELARLELECHLRTHSPE
jgi:hypothetical protein